MSTVARRWKCCACCEGIAKDDHVGFGGTVEKDGHDGPCESPCDQRLSDSVVESREVGQ